MLDQYQAHANIFKALMHPARLAILQALRDGEQCVCHLEALLGCRQAYISQHLSVLRDAGLVQDRRDGWNIFYRAENPQVFDLVAIAASLSGVPAAPQPAAQAAACPCPKCNPQEAGEPVLQANPISVSQISRAQE